jgi:Flp pilus assembly pilin Flp
MTGKHQPDLQLLSAPLLHKKSQRGQGFVEYALILSFVAILVIVVLALLGPYISGLYSNTICAIDMSGDLISGSGVHVGSNLTINTAVRQNTTLTISGSVSGGGTCAAPSCSYNFSGVPAHGTFQIKASVGTCTAYGGW